ncbi:MAG: Rrf2 family transcriptional regulator [Planctomycetes bacterium]|nr:Rrf2 family transcriptional regulator [Planctomycetota bacterium]
MLSLTKKTGYGLIALSHLAGLGEGSLASAREIADLFGLPTALMMNVLKELASAGFVESIRGARGGYRLLRKPEQISVAELVTVLEGPIRSSGCVAGRHEFDEGQCAVVDSCPLADPVHKVQRKISDFLRRLNLAEIAEPARSGGKIFKKQGKRNARQTADIHG